MATLPKPYLTPEEYLAIERKAEFKSEYIDGEMFAMAGVQREHNQIAANLYRELGNRLRGSSCQYYPSEMRVRTSGVHYCYPDASAVSGHQEFLDSEVDTLVNPSVLIEVLSPSTEAYDRGRKFDLYREIASLREYLMLASDRVHADLYVRVEDGGWLLRPYRELDSEIRLDSIGCSLKLADLYEGVKFERRNSKA